MLEYWKDFKEAKNFCFQLPILQYSKTPLLQNPPEIADSMNPLCGYEKARSFRHEIFTVREKIKCER